MEKSKLEFISRITTPDGTVIERKIEATDGLPAPQDFDITTEEGFLKDFDVFEKVALEARNRIAEEMTESYLDEISKKTPVGKTHRQNSRI